MSATSTSPGWAAPPADPSPLLEPIREAGSVAPSTGPVLPSAPEEALAELADLAAGICGTPMAAVTVRGAATAPVAWAVSLDQEVVATGEPLVVPDALEHHRWAGDQAVTGPLHLRFLVGYPLRGEDGRVLGSLCAAGPEPSALGDRQQSMLATLARQAARLLELRRRHAVEQRWRDLFEGSPVAIGLTDERTRIVSVNAALCELAERPAEELIGTSSDDYFHPDDRVTPEQITAWLAARPDRVLRSEARILLPGGAVRWVAVHLTRVDGFGAHPWTLAHVWDINARKLAQQRLEDAQADLTAVAGIVDEILTGGDAYQTIVEAVLTLSGADSATLVIPDRYRPGLFVAASTAPELVGHHFDESERIVSVAAFAAGRAVWVPDVAHQSGPNPMETIVGCGSLYGLPIRASGEVIGAIGVGWPVPLLELGERRATALGLVADHAGVAMRQARLVDELAAMTYTDALTGLPNRRHWDQHLEHLVSLTDRSQVPLTVAMIDLDRFKDYNDQHGHPAGDQLLRAFATAAMGAVRTSDLLARWGGEEFSLSLPCCPQEVAEDVFARMVAAVPDGQTCSIGYATWDGQETAAELLRRADLALYVAKRNGRNRIVAAS